MIEEMTQEREKQKVDALQAAKDAIVTERQDRVQRAQMRIDAIVKECKVRLVSQVVIVDNQIQSNVCIVAVE